MTEFLDQPPGGPALTAYDHAHLKLYIRLLDAEARGAHWSQVVEALFGICAEADYERAAKVHSSHLARARWMTQAGFVELLGQRLN